MGEDFNTFSRQIDANREAWQQFVASAESLNSIWVKVPDGRGGLKVDTDQTRRAREEYVAKNDLRVRTARITGVVLRENEQGLLECVRVNPQEE